VFKRVGTQNDSHKRNFRALSSKQNSERDERSAQCLAAGVCV